ncbi:MAG: hypothetical protein KIS79_03235 [Burkholderiales bacterium]|nr:hypothetical protein [Burkholderiales bacterium]
MSRLRFLSAPLGRAYLMLAAAALAAAVSVVYISAHQQRTEHKLSVLHDALHALELRVQADTSVQSLIARYQKAFLELEDAGFIGEGQPQRWAKAVRTAAGQIALADVTHESLGHRPLAAPYIRTTQEIALTEAVMRLRLSILHEGDLLDFLQALQSMQAGPYVLHSCAIERPRPASARTSMPALQAQCELGWVIAATKEEQR